MARNVAANPAFCCSKYKPVLIDGGLVDEDGADEDGDGEDEVGTPVTVHADGNANAITIRTASKPLAERHPDNFNPTSPYGVTACRL